MRLLLITNRYPCDADDPASPFVPHFVDALRDWHVDTDILTPQYRQAHVTEPLFVHRFRSGSDIPVGSWNLANPLTWLRLTRLVASGRRLGERLCRENDYDHILALWALPSGHFARALSRRYRIPYSVWCLGSDIYSWADRPVARTQIATILRDAANVFGDGEDLCLRVREWLNIACRYLPTFHPLDLPPCSPPAPTRHPRYLYLGRLHPDKGVSSLVEAFVRVRQVLPEARLRIVGDGPERGRLQKMCLHRRLAEDVTFSGAIARQGVADALQQCDFVVIPTRSDSLPLVFSEAVQAQRPVVATDVGDLGTFVRRFQVGVIAQSIDPGHLADAMIAMAQAPVFSRWGRDELLKLLDPRRAAHTFCECVFGSTGVARSVDQEPECPVESRV